MKEICEICGYELEPIYYKAEYKDKWRYEVDYLLCERCGNKVLVDGDYQASQWYYNNK